MFHCEVSVSAGLGGQERTCILHVIVSQIQQHTYMCIYIYVCASSLQKPDSLFSNVDRSDDDEAVSARVCCTDASPVVISW